MNSSEIRKRDLRVREQRCIQCGGFDANILEGRRRCKVCSMKANVRRSELREERRALGLCIYCGKEKSVDGRSGCRKCLDKIVERSERFHEKHDEK